MPKNLTKRGNIWYCTARVNGKRVSQSLNTTDQNEAMKRSRRLIKALHAGKWEILEEVQSKTTSCLSVGDFTRRYREIAVERERSTGKMRKISVDANIYSLYHVIRIVTGIKETEDIDKKSLNILTSDLLEKFVAKTVITGNIEMAERQRRTAYSYVRSVKSLFTDWVRTKMGKQLPDMQKFLACRPVESMRLKYHLPPEDLVDKTIKGARETLRQEKKDLYAVFLLCHDLGMRAGEAAQAQWSWIVEQTREGKLRRYMEISNRDGFLTKSRRGRMVPISQSVWDHLQEIKRPEDEWILPGGSPTVRSNLIKREFAGWMRTIGWNVKDYPKAAHELRKLIGSEWYTRFGVEVACNWLGHKSITTTFDYYADLKRHPDPIEI